MEWTALGTARRPPGALKIRNSKSEIRNKFKKSEMIELCSRGRALFAVCEQVGQVRAGRFSAFFAFFAVSVFRPRFWLAGRVEGHEATHDFLPMKKQNSNQPLVAILMGSDSDWPTMKAAADACGEFGIAHEVRVISAHRAPQDLARYASRAHRRGVCVLIAGAGGAAHLPGVTAAFTPLPVIGVPIAGKVLNGLDSLMSIVQMPSGVPVATVAIGGARNAGLLAVQILSVREPALQKRYLEFKAKLAEESRANNRNLAL